MPAPVVLKSSCDGTTLASSCWSGTTVSGSMWICRAMPTPDWGSMECESVSLFWVARSGSSRGRDAERRFARGYPLARRGERPTRRRCLRGPHAHPRGVGAVDRIKVLIADDHSVLRSGLRMLLGAQS